MKHSLGKLFFILLGVVMLDAQDFSYGFTLDKTTPYVKEAVTLHFEVKQTNKNIVLLFDFDLEKSKDYSFQRIGIQEVDAYHAVQIRYTYLIYPLRSGHIDIRCKLMQKATTDDSVAYSFSGDRDNVKGLVTTNTHIDLPAQILDVKALPQGTQLVGDFSVDFSLKSTKANAYEALPFTITLKGDGYTPRLPTLLPNEGNFTRFSEPAIVQSHTDAQGSHSVITYAMALSHDKDFVLPAITLKAFNPKTNGVYVLSVPSQTFDITPVAKSSLVDDVDNPPPLNYDFTWVQTFLGYLLVFLSGVMSIYVFKWKRKSTLQTKHPLAQKIHQTYEPKALLQLLMAHDSHRFSVVIKKLEDSLYGDAKINLNKVKKEAMDLL